MLLGCEHTHSARTPPDPLLLSKKPVASRPAPGPLLALARHEPPTPQRLLTSADTEGTPAHVPAIPTSLHDGDADER
jgi:hypothetical protein